MAEEAWPGGGGGGEDRGDGARPGFRGSRARPPSDGGPSPAAVARAEPTAPRPAEEEEEGAIPAIASAPAASDADAR
jgi:hypothetical protein